MSKNAKVEYKKLSDLTPDDHNANKGTERGNYMLTHSLEAYGAGRSILLDKDLNIIAGNKTHAKAGELGLMDVVLVHTTGDQIVAVVRDDLSIDSPEARGLAVADNRTTEVDLAWDGAELAQLQIDGVDLGPMFTEGELQRIFDVGMGLDFMGEAPGTFTGSDAPDALPESNVRMVQLFLNDHTQSEFLVMMAKLREHFSTTNPTDTVMEALRYACREIGT